MVPDRYDPLMDIGTAKTKGDAPVAQTHGMDTPMKPMCDCYDSTANVGTNGHDVMFGHDTRMMGGMA